MAAAGGSSGPSGAGSSSSSGGGTGSGGNGTGGLGGGSNNNNRPPTDIRLSNNRIKENKRKGSRIGQLFAIDSDSNDPFLFRLVDGEGSADNGSFDIKGNVLSAKKKFDYEKDNSHSIRVEVTDSSGKSYTKRFTIRITDDTKDNIRSFDSNGKPGTSLFWGNLTNALTRRDSIGFVEEGKRDKNDYFSFNLAQSGSLTVSLRKLKANADLQLFDALGNSIARSRASGRKSDILTFGFLTAGTYTVRVFPNGKSQTRYTLSLSTTPVPVNQSGSGGPAGGGTEGSTGGGTGGGTGSGMGTVPIDPNGSFETADINFDLGVIPVFDPTKPINQATSPLIQPGSIGFTETYGDDVNDYYKFTLASRSSIAVSISGMSADADLELYDSNFNQVGRSDNSGTQTDALLGYDFAPGAYYARVTTVGNGNAQTNYNLSLIADTANQGFGSILYTDPLTGSDQYLGTLNSQYTSAENSNSLKTTGSVSPSADEFYGFRVGSFTNNDIYITLLTLSDGASLQIYNSAFEVLYYTNLGSYSSYYGQYYETVPLSSLKNSDGLKWGELYYARVVATGGYSESFGLTVSDVLPTAIV